MVHYQSPIIKLVPHCLYHRTSGTTGATWDFILDRSQWHENTTRRKKILQKSMHLFKIWTQKVTIKRKKKKKKEVVALSLHWRKACKMVKMSLTRVQTQLLPRSIKSPLLAALSCAAWEEAEI